MVVRLGWAAVICVISDARRAPHTSMPLASEDAAAEAVDAACVVLCTGIWCNGALQGSLQCAATTKIEQGQSR
jgi:hypothetical protein